MRRYTMRGAWLIPTVALVFLSGIGVGSGGTLLAALAVSMPTATSAPLSAVSATPGVTTTPTPTATPFPTPTPTPRVTSRSFQFKVPARATHEEKIYLKRGVHLDGSFTVTSHDVDFSLWTNGKTPRLVLELDRARGTHSFSLTAEEDADCILWFRNSYSVFTSKDIKLSYTVTEP